MLTVSQLEDVLTVIVNDTVEGEALDVQVKDDIVRISQNDKLTGFNFLNLHLSEKLGPLSIDGQQLLRLNQLVNSAGFNDNLESDLSPKLVVAITKKVESHPDSDHLKVVQLDIGEGTIIQVVSGSPNMAENLKVVAVLPGAVMPSGQIIFPGSLRGIDSFGMIASGRELKIPGSPDVPGALVLPDDWQDVGQAFDLERAGELYE